MSFKNWRLHESLCAAKWFYSVSATLVMDFFLAETFSLAGSNTITATLEANPSHLETATWHHLASPQARWTSFPWKLCSAWRILNGLFFHRPCGGEVSNGSMMHKKRCCNLEWDYGDYGLVEVATFKWGQHSYTWPCTSETAAWKSHFGAAYCRCATQAASQR